jgi:hypothetical protein
MGVYGAFLYGGELYGSPVLLPNSADWDIYDFCEPTDLTMLSILGVAQSHPLRAVGAPHVFWDAANDLHLMSDDGAFSGFWIDYYVTNTFTFQFTVVPTQLPPDFSTPISNRVFFGVSNQGGKAVGVLLSANEGIALCTDPTGVTYTKIPFTAQLFGESTDYWVFRLTVNPDTGQGNLYVTRADVLAALTKHELICTFTLDDVPGSALDRTLVQVLGTAADPSEIEIDCIRMSSDEKISDPRPVAVVSEDQSRALGTYGFFDGRGSYDPPPLPETVRYWWTLTQVPSGCDLELALSGATPADVSGFTHLLTGAAGDYAAVRVGDLVRGDDGNSFVLYVSDDGSWLALAHKTLTAGTASGTWTLLRQSAWDGARELALCLSIVLDEVVDPTPLVPGPGDTYLVAVGALGAWVGHDGEIATWTGAAWSFTILGQGLLCFVLSSYRIYRTTGTKLWYPAWARPWEVDFYEGRTRFLGALFGTTLGLYAVELTVHGEDRYSLPVERLLSLYADPVPLGLPPEDVGFIWDYLSDFWQLVEDRQAIEVTWSALVQLYSSELVKLYQYEAAKSLNDVQRTFRHGWIRFSPLLEETNYDTDPASITITTAMSWYSGSPGIAPRTYQALSLPGTVVDGTYLVLDGLAYRVARGNGNDIYTYDDLPVAERPKYWRIASHVTSKVTDFSRAGVRVGDTALFEGVLDEDVIEIESYVWGVRGVALVFDDTDVVAAQALGYEVVFKGVRRRSALGVVDELVDLPRLQEYIDRGLDAADIPLEEGADFHVERITTVHGYDINTIQFYDPWFAVVVRGYYGYTGGPLPQNRFLDPFADFVTSFGASADLTGYVLELVETGKRYRLRSVVGPTELELYDTCLAPGLSDQRYRIRSIDVVPDTLWAEEAFYDNEEAVEGLFGTLLTFLRTHFDELVEGLDYLSVVRGLWYFVWHARTVWDMEVGSQVILGLPFAEEAGTITDIQDPFETDQIRVLVLGDETGLVKSYTFPASVGMAVDPDTSLPLALGDHVDLFDPLSGGVEIQDYIRDPLWWYQLYLGGAFYEPQKVHTWGIIVDADVFSLTNILFLLRFLKQDSKRRHKPHYTDPIIIVDKAPEDDITVAELLGIGPVVLSGGWTYPHVWPALEQHYDWTDCPFESPRAAVSNAPITGWTVPVPPRQSIPFGNLHLYDDPGLVPDQWTGAWPSGAPGSHVATIDEAPCMVDARDGLGHCVHRVDDVLGAVNVILDGDMEDPANPGAPGSPWTLIAGAHPLTALKSGVVFHDGAQSLNIQSVGAELGVLQDFPALVGASIQVGARVWVYVVSGCAMVQLISQDGVTVLAEKRASKDLLQWKELTLHAWQAGTAVVPLQIRITTGPAGGAFYVDQVGAWAGQLPWSSWGVDRPIMGRTGGYTPGGMPDEYHELMVYAAP